MMKYNINDLSAGIHQIRVEQYSRYGDVISSAERKLNIISQEIVKNNSNKEKTIQQSQASMSNSTKIPCTFEYENTIDDVYNGGGFVDKLKKLISIQSGSQIIDVSQHQGAIDWKKVSSSGVEYAMIRIGYRGYGNGRIVEDSKFLYNIQNALANGINVGVYYYSPAINTNEAKEDAEYIVNLLKKYGYNNRITLPIAIDLELVSGVKTRDINVSKSMRTDIANTFCNTISKYGYRGIVYACKSFLTSNMNANNIMYNVWIAQYNSKCTYTGNYAMWQYTSNATINGINTKVDCSIFYKFY